ncbi:efflux RND transporter periplasmic adaptor subunit [Rhizobium sp. BK376]|uniref:efflux RND transporter periplasmic adaptor subunit n=1 Tax=Rhizobium sp. BK376 TaxID=2512149 RepID=UPI0010EA7C87|nr:efflux RND transporter periplasmic adaptor subunit [Rhizobium sp. BK376]TCR85284.1 multidrug efflux system membrane fusion protein [Rhizobium sp. BK376]
MNPSREPPRKSGRKKTYLFGMIVLAAVGTGAALVWYPTQGEGRTKAKSEEAASRPIPVHSTKVMHEDLPVVRTGLGIVSPLSAVDVKTRVDGQLQHLAFTEGQEVKTGDAIATIDTRPYEAAVAQAQADYEKELAQVEQAKVDEERAQKLTTTGSGTTQAAQTAAAQVKIMEATAASGKAALDTAKLNLDFATIRAPVSGRTGLRQQEEGAILHATDSSGVVTITQMRPIAVQFTLTQDDLPDLVAGQENGPLPVSVFSRDGSKHLADGKLTVIDSQIDSTTGMVKLKAVFPNDDMSLWPGELITASITLRTDANTNVVPSSAIQNGQGGPYVFVVKPDQTVATASVTTGEVHSGMTAVKQGISTGDLVVTSGQSRLTDGTKVDASPADTNKLAATDGEKIQ